MDKKKTLILFIQSSISC